MLRPDTRIVAAVAGVAALLAAVLLLQPDARRVELLFNGDTQAYLDPARRLVETGSLGPSHRTPGYPLLLAPAVAAFAELGTQMVAIVVFQLALTVAATAVAVRWLDELAPGLPIWARSAAVGLAVWAWLDLAVQAMSDLPASVAFFAAVAIAFRVRATAGLAGGALLLAIATLCRPTFSTVPVLLPLAALWLRRELPSGALRAALIVAAGGLAGSAADIAYQQVTQGYSGVSPVVAWNLRMTDQLATGARDDPALHDARWRESMAAVAGRPLPATLDAASEEALARRVFQQRVRERPWVFARHLARTFVRYVFAPLERVVALAVAVVRGGPPVLSAGPRALLAVALLPVWLLALVPGPWLSPSLRRWTWAGVGWLVVMVGLASLAPEQGERMRLPAVPLLLPGLAANATALAAWWQTRRHVPAQRS